MPNIFQQLDELLARGLSGWNIYTGIILFVIACYIAYPAFFTPEPDIHPLLLARQSAPARIRYPGESATYRSLDAPHGHPLRTGLGIKDPGQLKWTALRDGDLRDIFRRAVNGPVNKDGEFVGNGEGKVSVVLGKEEVITYEMEQLKEEVVAIGRHLQAHQSKRVAILLANSTEFLVTLFACAFYGLTPVLIAPEQPLNTIGAILREAKVDTLIVGAGAISLTELTKLCTGLKQVVWVVARTSRHMDWHEVLDGEGGRLSVAVWHEIIDETTTETELPTRLTEESLPDIIVSDIASDGKFRLIEVSQKNLVAAISAQLAVLPRSYASTAIHIMTKADCVMPLTPLTDLYTLTIVLAAMSANAYVGLTSVAGAQATYSSTFCGVKPTIVIARPPTLAAYCAKQRQTLKGYLKIFRHGRRQASLTSGVMPKILPKDGQVRLIYSYEVPGAPSKPLSAAELLDLRIFTGARIIYALTDPAVAGAVCQTNLLDYQNGGHVSTGPSHFGPPLSCIEVKLKPESEEAFDDDHPQGRVVVSGPAVIGKEAILKRDMFITEHSTLALVI